MAIEIDLFGSRARADQRRLDLAQTARGQIRAEDEAAAAAELERQQASQRELAQALAGTPGPFASGMFPQPAFDPAAAPATQQRGIEAFLGAGGSAADAATLSGAQTEIQREQLTSERLRQDFTRQQIEASESTVELNQARLLDLDRQFARADAKERRDLEGQYRDDFTSAFQDMGETLLAFEQTDRLIQSGSSLDATIAITKLAKLADPGSTVRVEEGKMVASGLGLANQIATQFNKMAGKGFNEEARIAFRNSMKSLAEPAALTGSRLILNYAELAARHGLDLDAVVASSGVNPDLLATLATGQAQFNTRNDVEFSDLLNETNQGTIVRP